MRQRKTSTIALPIIVPQKTWIQQYEEGLGLTAGQLKEGDRFRSGSQIGTVLMVNDCRVKVSFSGNTEAANIAPATQIDEILGKENIMKTQKKVAVKTNGNGHKNGGASKAANRGKKTVGEKLTIRSIIINQFKKQASYQKMETAVKTVFPKSKFNEYHYKWYGQRLRREGVIK